MLKLVLALLVFHSAHAAQTPKKKPSKSGRLVCEEQLSLNFCGHSDQPSNPQPAPKTSPPLAPPATEVKPILSKYTKLVGVHVFETVPTDGRLGDSATIATRFSIGGVPQTAFATYKTFALVTPLERMIPQILSLHPFETIVMGAVQMQPGDVVIGPAEFRDRFPDYVKYMAGSLEGVDLAIKMLDGYQIQFNGTIHDGIAQEEHSQNMTALLSEITRQSASLSKSESNARFLNDITKTLDSRADSALSGAELDFRSKLAKKLVKMINVSEQDVSLARRVKDLKEKVDRFGRIVAYELKLRKDAQLSLLAETWRTLFCDLGDEVAFNKQLSGLQALQAELNEKAYGNLSNLDADSELSRDVRLAFEDISRESDAGDYLHRRPESRPSEWTDPRFATSLTLLPVAEVSDLLKLVEKKTTASESAKYNLRYAVGRYVLVGEQIGNGERLISLMAESIRRLLRAGFKSEQIRKMILEARLIGVYGDVAMVRPSPAAIRYKLKYDLGRTEEYDEIPTLLKVYLPEER